MAISRSFLLIRSQRLCCLLTQITCLHQDSLSPSGLPNLQGHPATAGRSWTEKELSHVCSNTQGACQRVPGSWTQSEGQPAGGSS